MFNLNLVKRKFEFTVQKQIIFFFVYAIGFFIIVFYPNLVRIDESTNWRPLWSIYFSITIAFLTTFFFIIPSSILSVRIYKNFEDKVVKKKWAYYMLGYAGEIFAIYNFIIYSTTTDPFLRVTTSILTSILVVSGILMYLGIGRQLQK